MEPFVSVSPPPGGIDVTWYCYHGILCKFCVVLIPEEVAIDIKTLASIWKASIPSSLGPWSKAQCKFLQRRESEKRLVNTLGNISYSFIYDIFLKRFSVVAYKQLNFYSLIL